MLSRERIAIPGTAFFQYIVKEKSQSVIVISDSEDEDSNAPLSHTLVQQREEIERRIPGDASDPIALSDSEGEDGHVDEGSNNNFIKESNDHSIEESSYSIVDNSIEESSNSIIDNSIEESSNNNTIEESLNNIIGQSVINQDNEYKMNIIEDAEMVLTNESCEEESVVNNLESSLSDDMMELDFISDGEMSDIEFDVISTTMESFTPPKLNLTPSNSLSITNTSDQNLLMKAPTSVTTLIPKDKDITYTLRQIELYLQSVTDIMVPYMNNETRVSRRTRDNFSNKNSPEYSTQYEPINPYVPNRAWYNSTWEDWAQLDVNDILHCPFTSDETEIIQKCVEKHYIKKTKPSRELVDFWQYVSTLLPGRTPLDCRCYWSDYKEGNLILYKKPVIITRQKDTSRNTSPHQLLAKRRRTGIMNKCSMRNIHISEMSREYIISEGSGDAIALAIFNDSILSNKESIGTNKDASIGLKVAVGSLCDENLQYNMPGNLRLWDSETKNCSVLKGHFTADDDGPEIWRTVTDVKMSKDQSFIYTASHEGSANIWRAATGKLVSTLQYHSKNINQLAVDYSKNENVLASCSTDGSATVWSIGEDGKTGSGVICELDSRFFTDPEVDCIEFGRNFTENKLFLGVNNKNINHPGFIEVYDTTSGIACNRYNSMNGSVSSLAIASSGKFVISGNYNRYDNMSGDGFIHLQDTTSRESVTKYYTGHQDVNIVAISPCDTYIASGNADKEKNEVLVFDVRNPRKVLHVLTHDQSLVNQSLIAPDSSIGIGGLYWMSDSRTIITGGGDSKVKVWNIGGATTLLRSYQTSNCVTSLTVHEETMTVAAGVAGAQGIVHVWQP